MNNLPKIIIIAGPTALGKTELGIKLAKKFNGEVVSADSRQVYKGMDIGTGKSNKYQILNIKYQNGVLVVDGVKHHLMDIIDPDEEFTVVLWKKKALAAIKDILKRGHLPIVVGGTGLYIKSLVLNLDIPEVPPDIKLREKLELRIKNHGLNSLYKELLKRDPGAEGVVDSKNPRRVIRALEVCLITGKPFSTLQRQGKPSFEVLELGVDLGREELYKRIDRRVLEIYKSELLRETKKLLKKYSPNLPSMSGIGYKEAGEHLVEKIDLEEAIIRTQLRTHAYARRQMTWFRKDKNIQWVKTQKQAEKLIRVFLTSNGKKE